MSEWHSRNPAEPPERGGVPRAASAGHRGSQSKDPGAREILRLLRQSKGHLNHDVAGLAGAIPQLADSPTADAAIIAAVHAALADLSRLQHHVSLVKCKTRRARRGQASLLSSLRDNQQGLRIMIAVVQSSDASAVYQLTQEQARLGKTAQAAAKAALAQLSR